MNNLNTYSPKQQQIMEAPREPQIPQQLAELARQMEEHEKALSYLAERIAYVIQPMPESATKECPTPMPVLAPLAENIRGGVDRLARMTQKLRNLTSSIEL